MPYLEDGETWSTNFDVHEEGMAENKPGHRKFTSYDLPHWAKHPLNHPFGGILCQPTWYMYAAGDGVGNHTKAGMRLSIAHIAAEFGDMEILDMATDEECSHFNCKEETPANWCVQYGTPWILQRLVERGADVTSPNNTGYTPSKLILDNGRLHVDEKQWLIYAIKGELKEKDSIKAQEYRIKKNRDHGMHESMIARWDAPQKMLQRRKYLYNMGPGDDRPFPPPEPGAVTGNFADSTVAKLEPMIRKIALPVALLFPGQGSQFIGMMKDVIDRPAVVDMLAKADAILGWSVKDLVLSGSEDQLSETKYCQPCMFIACMAALDLMKEKHGPQVENPMAVAGLSLGEYSALCAAEVLDFETCLNLVKLRAEAMQEAANLVPQTMCSVAGLDRALLDKLCEEAKADSTPGAVCQVSNLLFPAGFTCAGTKDAVDKLCVLAMAKKALQARVIKAGGGFHTSLMKPAEEKLAVAINEALPKMQPNRCAIYFNVTGKKVKAHTEPKAFVELMITQLTSEVRWDPSVKAMIADGVKDFYEIGPLKQLKSMMKRIDAGAFKRTENISV